MCCCSGSLKLGSLCLECSAADWKIKNLSNAEKSAWAGCPTTLKSIIMIDYFLVTTDVQGVVFTRVLEEDTFSIQCNYLSGSDVSGCVYVLVSRVEGVENVTGFIERDSNGVAREVANIGCYSKCWPMITPPSIKFFLSGQASTLVIHAPLVLVLVCSLHHNWLRIQSCVYLDPPIITSTSPSSGVTSTIIALISVVVVVVMVAVVLAVILFIVSFMFYQNKGMGFRL